MSTEHLGTAVITGASTGIGAIYADRLARRGYDLLLVARNRDRLEAVAQRVTEESGHKVDVLVADLEKHHDVVRVETVLRTNPDVTMLVNNAGFGSTAPLLQADVDLMDRMIALNVTALMRLTYAVAPAFAERKRGTIVNISSTVGIAPEMLNGVYGGTKAFVLALTRSLHHELGDQGVRIQAVLPGVTATEFWDLAGTPVSALPPDVVMPADVMVDAALAGLNQGELITIPALPNTADLDAYEAARQVLMPKLLRSTAAERYALPA